MKSTFFIILIFTCGWLIAQQNLIPNPSFEEYTSCPEGASASFPYELEKAIPWTYPTLGSSDLFAPCNTLDYNGSVGVPMNGRGYQMPLHGNCYAGFDAFDGVSSTGKISYSEYLSVPLKREVCFGELLEIRFFLSLANNSKFAVSQIGITIGDVSEFENSSAYPLDANLNILKSIGYVSDTVNWVEIVDTIKSKSNSKWLTIGYFNDNYDDTIVVNPNGINFAFYYVDSLSLIPLEDIDMGNFNEILPNIFSPNNDGVNDSFEVPIDGSIKIYNRWGRIVFSSSDINVSWNGLLPNGVEASEGTYYWIMDLDDNRCGLDSEQLKGTIQLVR